MEFGARCQTLKLSTPADVGNLSTSQLAAALAPGARVIKAFNHMTVPNLEADPVVNGARRVALVSADDDAVKSYSKSLPTPSLILETFAMEV
jgi:predicted dinucleotide-binding enzyme